MCPIPPESFPHSLLHYHLPFVSSGLFDHVSYFLKVLEVLFVNPHCEGKIMQIFASIKTFTTSVVERIGVYICATCCYQVYKLLTL